MERDRMRAQLQRAVSDVKYLREQVYQLGGEVPERRSRPIGGEVPERRSRPSRP